MPKSSDPAEHIPCTDIVQESVCIPAGDSFLNAVLSYPADHPPTATAVVVGPHPLLGGDMTNNVVTGLADGLCESGLATLRFNYAGSLTIGDAGTVDPEQVNAFWGQSHTEDETQRWVDLDAAMMFMRLLQPSHCMYLIPYSFGNYVAATWLRKNSDRQLPVGIVCVSPTVDKHDLSGLSESTIPKLVIASDDDFATNSDTLRDAIEKWQAVSMNLAKDRDGHFFRGHEPWLVQQATEFLIGLE